MMVGLVAVAVTVAGTVTVVAVTVAVTVAGTVTVVAVATKQLNTNDARPLISGLVESARC